jgi:hypothetical protein
MRTRILQFYQRSQSKEKIFRKASQLIDHEGTEQMMRNEYENKEILHLFENILVLEKTFRKVGQLIAI